MLTGVMQHDFNFPLPAPVIESLCFFLVIPCFNIGHPVAAKLAGLVNNNAVGLPIEIDTGPLEKEPYFEKHFGHLADGLNHFRK